jgi:hypothetical protein
MLADCELAARHLDFYHKPVKTTRRKLTENFGQRPGKDTIAKQYSCPLKWDHLTRLKRHTAQNYLRTKWILKKLGN